MERHSKSKSSKSKKHRKNKLDSSYQKITKFLSPKSDKSKTSDSKFQPLNITKTENDNQKKSKLKKQSSFEKILADQKKFEEHKAAVQVLVDEFDENLFDTSLLNHRFSEEKKFSQELLDCRDLSFEQLEMEFDKHLHTLKGIMKGRIFSKRHENYYQKETCADLKTSDSIVVFSEKQNEYLLDLLARKLDPENKFGHYFFKVLWPELCFLIFVDHHGMTEDDAQEYLKQRPVD